MVCSRWRWRAKLQREERAQPVHARRRSPGRGELWQVVLVLRRLQYMRLTQSGCTSSRATLPTMAVTTAGSTEGSCMVFTKHSRLVQPKAASKARLHLHRIMHKHQSANGQ